MLSPNNNFYYEDWVDKPIPGQLLFTLGFVRRLAAGAPVQPANGE
jgi:hypothetical protein